MWIGVLKEVSMSRWRRCSRPISVVLALIMIKWSQVLSPVAPLMIPMNTIKTWQYGENAGRRTSSPCLLLFLAWYYCRPSPWLPPRTTIRPPDSRHTRPILTRTCPPFYLAGIVAGTALAILCATVPPLSLPASGVL
ncbi:hypothetical protein DPEC_G00172430 [Dallia pectoralis]|uniref:Uncharacterized protein n=1 Tax=Dallia pectoralis TaxID=75939 RepID=A0ACC2GDW1_DALPE|nr:hypothetical protein DPEC_G00172430 [Dallia pectoralis]